MGVAQSSPYQVGRSDAAAPEEAVVANSVTGVLPYQAVSVVGLLALLVRWSALTERLGGMREETGRLACTEMLSSWLEACCSSGSWTCSLVWEQGWQNKWPRPESGGPRGDLHVRAGGIVDVAALGEPSGAAGSTHPVAARWQRALLARCEGDFSLQRVLGVAAATRELHGLFRQLIWHVGRQVHDTVMRALKGQAAPGFAAKEVSMKDVLADASRLDTQLVRYVASCRSASAGSHVVSVATDKSSVCGLQLQNSVVVLPCGKALIAPPQVALEMFV